MKYLLAFALIALLATAQASTSALVARSVGGLARPQDIVPPKGDWCEACVIFMNSQIEELEQIIANIGISDGCACATHLGFIPFFVTRDHTPACL